MPVIQNKKGSSAVIRATATETINLVDLQTSGETVTGFVITKVYWSAATGQITVARGGTTLLSLTGNGDWKLDTEVGSHLAENQGGAMVLTLTANSTLILEVRKISTFASDYQG